jgi:hypothetical protein
MTRADKAVLLGSLLALVALYAYLWTGSGPAEQVSIATSRGTQVFSLQRDRRVRVHGARGDSVIEIRHGRVRFAASPCGGKLCIHAGWLDRAGETAACVPNGVIVSLAGRDEQYDSINF